MLELYDRVFDKVAKSPCFVVEADDHGADGVVCGLEAEGQESPDWFRWAERDELEKLLENG